MNCTFRTARCLRSIGMWVVVCMLSTACRPPGRIVEGTFTVDGNAKAGVEVRLGNGTNDADCGGGQPNAVTDGAGRFRAIATGYPIQPCFAVDGVDYSTFLMVNDHQHTPIQLTCALPLHVTGHFEDGQICW